MRPHPRIRKTIKWGGAAVTALLVVVWIGSGWCNAGYLHSSGIGVDTNWGVMSISRTNPSFMSPESMGAWWMTKPNPAWCWWRGARSGLAWEYQIPLWLLPLAPVIPAFVAWRLDASARRARLNLCPKCNYDRPGIVANAKCPECGAMPVVSR